MILLLSLIFPLFIFNACSEDTENVSDQTKEEIQVTQKSQESEALENPTADFTINVSTDLKQEIFLGIDVERLWWWYPSIRETLAKYAVKEMNTKFARVSIQCGYSLTRKKKDASAYTRVLDMMNAFKDANPDLKFFATPTPLKESYTEEMADSIWGSKENIPWTPYPTWVLPFTQDGTKIMEDGTEQPNWVMGTLNVDALVEYYTDYLNFIYNEGFTITYLDVTNEKNIITPAILAYLYKEMPKMLNTGVNMPILIGLSTWSVEQGVNWLKTFNSNNKDEIDALGIASTHNTNSSGNRTQFVNMAKLLGKVSWNTELHDWVGIDTKDEVLNSEIFWLYERDGFTGMCSWLFFGPIQGKDHTMLWTNGSKVIKSAKYEIYKTVVNNANGGKYVETDMPNNKNVVTASFLKDRTLTVWILNKTVYSQKIKFNLSDRWKMHGKYIIIKRWNENLPKSGMSSSTTPLSDDHSFYQEIEGESLYCFKIDLSLSLGINNVKIDK